MGSTRDARRLTVKRTRDGHRVPQVRMRPMAPGRRPVVLLLVVVLLAGAGFLLAPTLAPLAREGVDRLARAGVPGALAFIAAFVVASLLFLPAALLGIAAGAAYGVWLGSALSLVGGTLGAMASFLVARRWARRPLEAWAARSARMRALDAAFRTDGLRTAFLLRLSPLIPFNLLNYALGATALRARDATIACLAMIP